MTSRSRTEQLFRLHYQKLYTLARVMLHEDDAAQDVVSDVFMDVATGRTQLPENREEAYLVTAMRNKCLNIIRRHHIKERIHELMRMESTPDLVPADRETDKLSDVLRYIDTALTPQTARIIRQHYCQKMTYHEISEELNISEAAVYKHLAQGIKKLKQQFNP